jgi:hypothetical protein
MRRENMSQDENQILRLLEKLQEGYRERAISVIDAYTHELFVPGDDMTILGTSDGEWRLGYEEAKGLIESDWTYWGDVWIDTTHIHLTIRGDVAWFHTLGSVEQDFSTSDATYDAFAENVRGYLDDEECWLGRISDETRLTTIAWELTHLLTGEGKRYRWSFRLSGVAVRLDSDWRFRQLQFSLPTTSRYPDERILKDNVYEKSHHKDSERLKSYHATRPSQPEITSLAENFNKDFLDARIASGQLVERYFSTQEDALLIGTGTDTYRGAEGLATAMTSYREQWDSVRIGTAEAILDTQGETAWLQTQGEAKSLITSQDAIRMEMEKAREILDSPSPSKEKLFRINRNIITMVNEHSKGESYEWPIRFEAVLVRENARWVFHYLQLSYSSNIILEGRMDAAVIIE